MGTVLIGRWYWWRVNAWSEISALAGTALMLVLLHTPWAADRLTAAYQALRLVGPEETPSDLFGMRCVIATAFVTGLWVLVTFLTTARQPSPRTIEFYRKLRVAGPGWAQVAKAAAIEPVRGEFGRSFAAWIISMVWLYSLLLAIGKLLLYEWKIGIGLLAVSLVSGEALRRFLARHGLWDELKHISATIGLSHMKRLAFSSLFSIIAAAFAIVPALPTSAAAADASLAPPAVDWLINPESFKAKIAEDTDKHELTLENGLIRRTLRLTPNVATVNYTNLVSGEQLLRAAGPEARVTINSVEYAVGGLMGQPVQNYLKRAWIDTLRANPTAYRFKSWKEDPAAARFPWKKRSAWLSRDLPWPAPGKQVTLTFVPPASSHKTAPAAADLPEIDIHYTIYDGIPLIEKWLTIRNATDKPVRVNKTIVETLNVVETEAIADPNINIEPSNLYVETDYSFLAMNAKSANKQVVKWLKDKNYHTQVSYFYEAPVLLEVAPEFGPDVDVAAGGELTSIRAFELFRDGTDRERRGLSQRRMYRCVAPWSQENPVMVHLISSNPEAIRRIIDQAADVGVEMIILSFGSGLNMESPEAKYQATYKEVAEYAKSKGIVIGAYSLLASRGAGNPADNCRGPGNRIRYGVMPCLGSTWGQKYLRQIRSFLTNTDFGVFENDGSYPGDTCAATDHPGHHGLEDSQWVQFRAIAGLYQWCRAEGIYLNVPDWYFLNGSSKTAMGYRETNWSLPRAEQEIIERQNVYDGTWEKTASMGWMMVPLTQYHGGGAAATIEPLHEHLPHYETRLANLFGAGVQACYRGPRIFDTDATKALVSKWVSFYKAHRPVLDADMIHLRRPDGRDWDGFVHVNPQGKEKALAFFYNPLPEPVERDIRVPLYYAGLKAKARVSVEDGSPEIILLDRTESATIRVRIPAQGHTWLTFSSGDAAKK